MGKFIQQSKLISLKYGEGRKRENIHGIAVNMVNKQRAKLASDRLQLLVGLREKDLKIVKGITNDEGTRK